MSLVLTEQGYTDGQRSVPPRWKSASGVRFSSALLLDRVAQRTGKPLAFSHDVTSPCAK